MVLDDLSVAQVTLANLESQMSYLVRVRNEKVQAGQAMIDQANRVFDKTALPLARRINALRDQLEAGTTSPPPPPRRKQYKAPDPDWCPEDIAHYHELMQR